MQVKYNSEGLPYCPDCQAPLSCESAGNRDTETIGGYSVDYFVCDNGCGYFEVIAGSINHTSEFKY